MYNREGILNSGTPEWDTSIPSTVLTVSKCQALGGLWISGMFIPENELSVDSFPIFELG